MNNPATDEIVNYLSTKFNKIFCDRDFVCCVAEDFQFILNNKNKCCVLLFPILGPIYQKAVRYQAKIFDLAVFGVNSGKHKSIAVCHKHYLVKKVVEEVMEETCSINSRRKRPERQLYVPPAQRGSRLPREAKDESPPKSKSKLKKSKSEEIIKFERIIPLKCLLYLIGTKPVFINWKYHTFLHSDCVFYGLHKVKQNKWTIPIYQKEYKEIFLDILHNNTLVWQPTIGIANSYHNPCANSLTYPIINIHPESIEETTIFDRTPIWAHSYDTNCLEDYIECCFYKVLCNANKISDQHLLDLSVFKLPHFMIIRDKTDEYMFTCKEDHNIDKCYELKRIEFLKSKTNDTKNNNIETTRVLEISKVKNNDMIKNDINSNREKMLKKKDEHDQEKEIMRKTKENINRKSKPIIKYVGDSNDTLKIGKDDENVNNWEDLFDDKGQLQDELFTEIVQKVGNDVTIVKATEDYSAYTTKPIEEFEHVVELFNFPPTLETHDIIQIFSDINSDAMYIKWVDDTHALLVLGSLSQGKHIFCFRQPPGTDKTTD
ncbi:unnamed protein product [Brassicogethes aeneus]|uniref:Uncharacterized protein n=1 Tax=Brassicogethes aeneus TaxID=1431903 RepID=A0A9P0FNL8_BRAAE|nr:unnamed protein product [Brassicogethes aeneus]